MEELKTKIMAWVENNKAIAAVIGIVAAIFIFKKLNRPTRRRRRRVAVKTYRRRTVRRMKSPVSRRRYSKTPTGKKAWQVKGSLAARRRMAQLRARRRRKLI